MKLYSLLPFMDKEELMKLAVQILEGEVKGVEITALFPFLGKESLDDLVDQFIEKDKTDYIYRALPFISKEKIKVIQEAVTEGKLKDFREEALLPFMGKEAVKALFDHYVKKAHEEALKKDDEKEN